LLLLGFVAGLAVPVMLCGVLVLGVAVVALVRCGSSTFWLPGRRAAASVAVLGVAALIGGAAMTDTAATNAPRAAIGSSTPPASTTTATTTSTTAASTTASSATGPSASARSPSSASSRAATGRSSAPVTGPGSAAVALSRLPVKGRAPQSGYSRDQFGPAWSDDTAAPDGAQRLRYPQRRPAPGSASGDRASGHQRLPGAVRGVGRSLHRAPSVVHPRTGKRGSLPGASDGAAEMEHQIRIHGASSGCLSCWSVGEYRTSAWGYRSVGVGLVTQVLELTSAGPVVVPVIGSGFGVLVSPGEFVWFVPVAPVQCRRVVELGASARYPSDTGFGSC
jgi:hypothetical protein